MTTNIKPFWIIILLIISLILLFLTIKDFNPELAIEMLTMGS